MPRTVQLLTILIGILLGFNLLVSTTGAQNATGMVEIDENIQASDLDIKEPTLLPDHPFYFLKNWGRTIQSFFTFNPVKKAELRLKFANEKIIEAKKLVKKGATPEKIKKALKDYEQELDRIKKRTDKFKVKAEENTELNRFLDKYTQHQALHYRILQRLEKQVPPEVYKIIEENRKKHLERFKEVMLKLEDENKIPERLEKNIEGLRGSQFKEFKSLEILEELKEKFPEDIQEKIQERQERILEKLQKRLEGMPSEDQAKFKDYIEKISGDKLKHLQVLAVLRGEEISPKLEEVLEEAEKEKIDQIAEKYKDLIKEKVQKRIAQAESEVAAAGEAAKTIDPEVYRGKAALRLLKLAKNHLEQSKQAMTEGKYGRAYGLATAAYHEAKAVQRIVERIEAIKIPEKMKEKFKELYPGISLPFDWSQCKLYSPPKCPKGKIVVERDENDCPIFKCEPLEKEGEQEEEEEEEKVSKIMCPMLWEPVCGTDGKTYTNKCVAENIAKAKIAHKGICEEVTRPLKEVAPELKEQLKQMRQKLEEKLQP